MSRGGGGGGQNPTDQSTNFFWLLCLIMGTIVVVWWLCRQYLVIPIFWFRVLEVDAIQYVMSFWSKVAPFLHLPRPDMSAINHVQKFMLNADPKTIDYDYFAAVNTYIGKWVRFPVMTILFGFGSYLLFFHSSMRFREIHNMNSLKKLEVENWPQITPVLTLDLVKEDIEKGPWAMAKVPLDFCKENNLLTTKFNAGKQCWSLKRGPAYRVFALQLGPLWRGAQNLPIHMKALFIIFVSRTEKDKEVAKKLLFQIASSASSGKLDFTGVEELVKKYQHVRLAQWLESRHAYVYTFMASLLEISRSDGVLATAEFLWLKPLDRRLWYVLNNVGRQTAFVENAGPYAHWLAEKKVGKALKTPMVKEAVNGMEQAIDETLYIAEGERWRTNSAA
jgi:intracellular multiplication protein IcmP